MSGRWARCQVGLVAVCVGCLEPTAAVDGLRTVNPANHRWFPIASGTHAVGRVLTGYNASDVPNPIACESCHDATAASFSQFSCVGCHIHARELTDRLHGATPGYRHESPGCYACHTDGARAPYGHPGITQQCAACHDVGAPFAALPRPGFIHPERGDIDCGACHVTRSWREATVAPAEAHDPLRSRTVVGLIPAWSGSSIMSFSAQSQTLRMVMDHATPQAPSAAMRACGNCHAGSATGSYYPGDFHASVAALGIAQPTRCSDCHAAALPSGFVGPTATTPVRTPASGEMAHDAFEWSNGARTATRAVGQDCGVCHRAPSLAPGAWADAVGVGGTATYHAALAAAGVRQPSSCLDCHANSRPTGVVTSANAAVPAGLRFDHGQTAALADCATCHQASAAGVFASWAGGRFHPLVSAPLSTCLPCHTGERPVSTTGWVSPTYPQAPFDYGTNARGVGHGNGMDCVVCHDGAATRNGSLSWQGGYFAHGPGTASESTCIACHTTQRPDLLPGTTPAAMAALLRYDHASSGTGDCMGCHQATVTAGTYANYFNPMTHALPGGDWQGAQHYPGDAYDPARNIVVNARIPSYAGTDMVSVSPQAETLTMRMDHATHQVAAAVMTDCSGCHATAEAGAYFPGELHPSLANLDLPQPTTCAGCHQATMPVGMVGPVDNSRQPASGGMKHDAVHWANRAPTAMRAVTQDCAVCHASPSAERAASWVNDRTGSGRAVFHASLSAAGQPQPGSCLDCHANSRPAGVLDSTTARLPGGVEFDHRMADALVDCAACHSTGGAATWTSWAGGQFHLAGAGTPATCLPCHRGERPTTTSNWVSTTFQEMPFDYVTNALGVTHGAGLDCVQCHTGPGSGAWGAAPNWIGGVYRHAPAPQAGGPTCVACHMTQRPDLQPGTTAAAMATLLGFDHSTGGAGDCLGCHRATVTANRYAHYVNPATGALPGGDWRDGVAYPGDTLVASQTAFITATTLTLLRSGAYNLVRGMTLASATLHNAMVHTSAAVPVPVHAGSAADPDFNACWHCHAHNAGTVTSYLDGTFHAALAGYSATPGAAVTPLPQPAARCNDCHAQMRPPGIVQRAGSNLRPMDHNALFTATVILGGAPAMGVADLDCASCHTQPGGSWDDGTFHPNIGAAVPLDCTVCHYPLMADTPRSDPADGTHYSMRHASAEVAFQNCIDCHTEALATSATTRVSATAFAGATFHPHVSAQPVACLDCHAVSQPAAGASTQSSVTYSLPMGGTATNGAQWMNHGARDVVGKDCVVCHAAGARTLGSAWLTSDSFHAAVANAGACGSCHGLGNGQGSVPGTNNNLPVGLINSATLTTTASTPGAGRHDQISHTDVNVASHDCGFCHTQQGVSAAPAVQGREWAQADFHVNFTGATALVMNRTSGRCSNCHMNLKPDSSVTRLDHSTFSSAPGTEDCAACHAWPGTGTTAAPNWLGAAGVPPFLAVGGFTIPRPPAAAAGTLQAGISNLPHPAVAAGTLCTACHTTASGGRRALGYDHLSPLINTNCNACHEAAPAAGGAAFNDLLGTLWSGATVGHGAGDSRPYTLTGVVPSFKANNRPCMAPNHFYPTDCRECHVKPAGNGLTTTGAAFITAWRFRHATGAPMTKPATCNKCHASAASGGCGIPD